LGPLTPKGEALAPVIDALVVWGMDHALGQPAVRHSSAGRRSWEWSLCPSWAGHVAPAPC